MAVHFPNLSTGLSAFHRSLAWLMRSPQLGRLSLVFAVLGLLVAVFSLASAAGNNRAWAEHYSAFLWTNIAMIVVLIAAVIALLSRLLLRLQKARFGARLTLKFATAFALLGLTPGVMVYLVSVLFLSQSIDSWFNVRVDKALDAGLELSRAAINAQLQTLVQKTRTAAVTFTPTEPYGTQAQRIRGQFGEVEVVFFGANGTVLANAGAMPSQYLLTDTPIGNDFQTLKRTGVLSQIESIPANELGEPERLQLRAAVLVPKPLLGMLSSALPSTDASATSAPIAISAPIAPVYIQLSQAVSPQVSQWAQTVAQGSKDYETLSLGRTGLRKIYGATLTITMLLSVLAAVAAGFVLADAMSAPLLRLARGTQAVASGDFSLLPEPKGKDDLAVLTRSFNRMLYELGNARGALTQNNHYLAQVLTSLSTGVLVVDAQQNLRSINPSAQAILGLTTVALNHSAAVQLPPQVWHVVLLNQDKKTDQKSDSKPDKKQWQLQIEIPKPSGEIQTLLLRGAALAQDDGVGLLLVFDDVTDVMLAQKAQAWGEVAQRLAHEIKNPLTPIQLSAERLVIKLADKLAGADADLLKRAAATIIHQVAALKHMVDEFRQYARMPQAQLAPIALNAELRDILQLYKAKHTPLHIELNAQNDAVMADALQLRQVVHNLLGNAFDAALLGSQSADRALLAQPATPPEARVDVSTDNTEQGVRLRITDNGLGFSTHALAKLFEPYHTTKAQGTGLGLAIVHRIVQDHKASIKVKNQINDTTGAVTGAVVDIVFATRA